MPLAILVIQYASCVHCKESYITPSPDIPCHRDPCLTLSQFADNYTVSNDINCNISLIFLPGNHSLDRKLYVSRADNLSMTKDTQSDETVLVKINVIVSLQGLISVK